MVAVSAPQIRAMLLESAVRPDQQINTHPDLSEILSVLQQTCWQLHAVECLTALL